LVHKYDPKYYQKNKESIKESRRRFRERNREKIQEQRRRWNEKRKEKDKLVKPETLAHYGLGKLACVKCGFDDIRALTLDHIVPIGRQKRRVTGIQFYKQLRKQDYPEGFQTLCANCQMIKMFEGNEWELKS